MGRTPNVAGKSRKSMWTRTARMRLRNKSNTNTSESQEQNIQKVDIADDFLLTQLNDIFKAYIGKRDNDMSIYLLETASKCANLQEMMQSVRNSDLNMFEFPDELIQTLCEVVLDWNKAKKEESTKKMDKLTIEELE